MSEVLKNLSDALAATVEKTSPSIVRVEARRRLPASGIVWSSDGKQSLIVTANHVVESDENITLGLHNGESVAAALIGRDPGSDIALLRTSASLTTANWANDESLRVGHLVLAMGRPGQTVQVTLGVVSAIGEKTEEDVPFPFPPEAAEAMRRATERGGRRARRWMTWMNMPFGSRMEGAIQTDVTMYPGFSGGPLVDAAGVVRGMNSSALRGVSMTIPVARLRRTAETLLTHGRVRQGFLGVGAQPVRLPDALIESLNQETGLLLVSVESGSPAASGGLYVGDTIVSLDHIPVRHLDELIGLLNGDRVGKAVPVQIVRGGQLHDLTVTIGERM